MKEISDFLMNLYSLTEIKIIAFSGILGGIIAKCVGGLEVASYTLNITR